MKMNSKRKSFIERLIYITKVDPVVIPEQPKPKPLEEMPEKLKRALKEAIEEAEQNKIE